MNVDVLGVVLEWIAPTCRAVPAETRAFHEVVRVLNPLALSSTWYHAFEPPPAGVDVTLIADVVVDGVNLRGAPSLSADQAGGGLITTTADLTRLMRGLVAQNPVSLDAPARDFARDTVHSGIDIGLGAWRLRPAGVTFMLTQACPSSSATPERPACGPTTSRTMTPSSSAPSATARGKSDTSSSF